MSCKEIKGIERERDIRVRKIESCYKYYRVIKESEKEKKRVVGH